MVIDMVIILPIPTQLHYCVSTSVYFILYRNWQPHPCTSEYCSLLAVAAQKCVYALNTEFIGACVWLPIMH